MLVNVSAESVRKFVPPRFVLRMSPSLVRRSGAPVGGFRQPCQLVSREAVLPLFEDHSPSHHRDLFAQSRRDRIREADHGDEWVRQRSKELEYEFGVLQSPLDRSVYRMNRHDRVLGGMSWHSWILYRFGVGLFRRPP
ncbi:hypothetical protein P43SY_011053 [Pythium insidiosum]|uniref:Uncharacterized protein n=1 Tax=Pythium insidiosum TaxID=114742 RepID=A0AAD5Q349_PYTIN|nr:hypothetical protein P43SY_011053 [Pythium insidiosum]